MNVKIKCRNINLELLRILSMFMIIFLHSIDYSGVSEKLVPGTMLYYYEYFSWAAVQVCVNCFVLISGYFLVQSHFRLSKIISIWVEVVFYSLIIKGFLMVIGVIPVSAVSLASCFFPIITGRYWFVTIYFGMYLLSPIYSVAAKALTKRQYQYLLAVLFVLSSVMISIHPALKGMNSGGSWGLAWFTVLFFAGAYFRLHYERNGHWKKASLVYIACPAVMLCILFLAQCLQKDLLISMALNLWRYDSVPVVIASIAITMVFINIGELRNIKVNRFVIKVSSTTFGVYLIHAHANVCTEFMWQKIGSVLLMKNWWYPLYQILIVAAIFVVCSILELGRQYLFEKTNINKLIENAISGLNNYIRNYLEGE